MKTPELIEACPSGSLHAEDWVEPLIQLVASEASNQDLLTVCQLAARGLDEEGRLQWMDSLIEFSLWETGGKPWRLDLCDYLIREGLARIESPRRWESFGGLLHVACEAGSIEAIRWAMERCAATVGRTGGFLGICALHSLAMHESQEVFEQAAPLLVQGGINPDQRTRDGRNCLFRCSKPWAARLMMALGADPWALDSEGHNAVGYWLELGMWRHAAPAFEALPQALGSPQPWGSLRQGPRKPRRPLRDLPLFIFACSATFRGSNSMAERAEGLRGLAALGADPLAKDAQGRSLSDRCRCPSALALMEERMLEKALDDHSEGREGGSSRL